ncbi:MAG: ABC transporter ATP-binding protein [Rhodospirillales bacterium]|jgi:microcin C transport system ATP-binding protein|nr:ABC transporter ATP-binding protein [Rhodospirillales bacterium]
MTLLTVDGLAVAFGTHRVVDGVSFALERGETLALVGESGSGKSMTARSVLGLLPPGARNPAGRICFDGQDVLGVSEQALRGLRGGRVGMVFQEPMTSLNPLHRIGRQVAEAIALHRAMPRRALRAEVIAALTRAGFADATQRLDAFPHQLSGGQRQRVMIAMALANHPVLLIADEPTTALDVTIEAQILDLLARQKQESRLALLLITHDLSVVRRYADRVAVMRAGRIVEQGAAAQVFAAPSHPYTRMLLAAEPKGRAAPLRQGAPALLEARSMQVSFGVGQGFWRRGRSVLRAVDDVSLTVREGETVGVVGESGSGKTTLGFALLRLHAARGQVAFAGRDLASLDRRALCRLRASLQVVFQDPFGSLSPRLTVGDIVAEGLRVHAPQLSRAERDARVAAALEETGLPARAMAQYPHEFSGGQRQRIAIARAMVLKPRFVVLDEPTSALDMSVQSQIVELLRRLQREHGLAYLFISHDLKVVRALAHRIVVMRHGRIMEAQETEALFAAPREPYTRALIAAAFAHQPGGEAAGRG